MINASATVIVHICTVTVAIVHKFTILHPLMWVFFAQNVCEINTTFKRMWVCIYNKHVPNENDTILLMNI